MPTLYCETGRHEWERETVRGRHPHDCPAHGGPQHAAASPDVDAELVALYVEETRQPTIVVTAFLMADREPPHRDTTTERGFSFREVALIDAARTALGGELPDPTPNL